MSTRSWIQMWPSNSPMQSYISSVYVRYQRSIKRIQIRSSYHHHKRSDTEHALQGNLRRNSLAVGYGRSSIVDFKSGSKRDRDNFCHNIWRQHNYRYNVEPQV
jgi:hypothetical protein